MGDYYHGCYSFWYTGRLGLIRYLVLTICQQSLLLVPLPQVLFLCTPIPSLFGILSR